MANIAKRADGHRRARYRDAHGKEHARHSTERLTPRTGWTRSRPQCRPASTSTPIAARSQSGIGPRVGLTVRRIQSRPRTSAMPTSCASTFSRSGPLCASSTSRTPTCRRGFSRLAARRSPATVRKVHRVFSLIVKTAVRDGRLARNPAAEINLPRVVATERRYLTHEQVHALAQALAKPRGSQ